MGVPNVWKAAQHHSASIHDFKGTEEKPLCTMGRREREMTCPVTHPLSLAAGLALDTCKPPVAAGEAGCACADTDGAAAGWRAASCPAAPSAIHFNLNVLLSSEPAWSHCVCRQEYGLIKLWSEPPCAQEGVNVSV